MSARSGKIGLGTVQFGLPYGINNRAGRVSVEEAGEVVKLYCKNCAHPVFDTALAYGESQIVLGSIFNKLGLNLPAVISKFSASDFVNGDLHSAFEKCASQLGVNQLYGFLCHDPDNMLQNEAEYASLINLKKKGLVKKTGISAYFPRQIEQWLARGWQLDLVQIPYNIFDRRFEPYLSDYTGRGIEVHTRSVFMQGLIFKPLEFFEGYFSEFSAPLIALHELSRKFETSVSALALQFVLQNESISKVIMGVDSATDLRQHLIALNGAATVHLRTEETQTLTVSTENILLPFNWPKS